MTPKAEYDILAKVLKSRQYKAVLRSIPVLPKVVYIIRGVKVLGIEVTDIDISRSYPLSYSPKPDVIKLNLILFWLNVENKPEPREISLDTSSHDKNEKTISGVQHRTLPYPEVFMTRKEAFNLLKKSEPYKRNLKERARLYLILTCYFQYTALLLGAFLSSAYLLLSVPLLLPFLIRNSIIIFRK